METRHTHAGNSAGGSLLDTGKRAWLMTTRGEQLVRMDSGSASGNALPGDTWASTDCLEWTSFTYHSDTGKVLQTETSNGQWTQDYFYQDRSFRSSVPSYYPSLTEGNRYYIHITPEKATTDTLATHISNGHVYISGFGAASASQLDSNRKQFVNLLTEERLREKIMGLSTTASSIVGTGSGATFRLTTTARRDPNAGTPVTEVTTRDAYAADHTDVFKRWRVFVTENPDGTKSRLDVSSCLSDQIMSAG